MSWFRSDRRRAVVPILGFSAAAFLVWAVVAASVGYELSCGWGIGCYPTGDTLLWFGAIIVSVGGLLHAAVASTSLAREDADGRTYGGAWAVLALVAVGLGVWFAVDFPSSLSAVSSGALVALSLGATIAGLLTIGLLARDAGARPAAPPGTTSSS